MGRHDRADPDAKAAGLRGQLGQEARGGGLRLFGIAVLEQQRKLRRGVPSEQFMAAHLLADGADDTCHGGVGQCRGFVLEADDEDSEGRRLAGGEAELAPDMLDEMRAQ